MTLKIDPSLLIRPYTTLPLDEKCLILLDTFSSLVERRLSESRPYILAYVIDRTQNSKFCDAIALQEHFSYGKWTNPATRELAEKIHFFLMHDAAVGFTHIATSEKSISKDLQTLITASSQDKTPDVLSARKSVILKHVSRKEIADAKMWLKITLKDFPQDPFAFLQLGNLLGKTKKGSRLLQQAKILKRAECCTAIKKTASTIASICGSIVFNIYCPSPIILPIQIGSIVYNLFYEKETVSPLQIGSSITSIGFVLFPGREHIEFPSLLTSAIGWAVIFKKLDDDLTIP